MSSQLFQLISNELDSEFDSTVYTDFTRHNGLYEYAEWTLPLWAHIIVKKKMTPINAFRALTLAMTPFYVSFKGQD